MILDTRYLSHIEHFRPSKTGSLAETYILVTAVLWRRKQPFVQQDTTHYTIDTFSLLSEILSQRKLIEEITRLVGDLSQR